MDLSKFPSHGQMIGWEMAESIGLAVTYIPPGDSAWRRYWALYCHLRLSIEAEQRIFESDFVSLTLP